MKEEACCLQPVKVGMACEMFAVNQLPLWVLEFLY